MKSHALQAVTTVAGVVSLLCLIGYFMALRDIFHDYASPQLIRQHVPAASTAIPDWASCGLEWKVLGACFWPMLVFHLLFLAGLIITTRATKTPPNAPSDAPADSKSGEAIRA